MFFELINNKSRQEGVIMLADRLEEVKAQIHAEAKDAVRQVINEAEAVIESLSQGQKNHTATLSSRLSCLVCDRCKLLLSRLLELNIDAFQQEGAPISKYLKHISSEGNDLIWNGYWKPIENEIKPQVTNYDKYLTSHIFNELLRLREDFWRRVDAVGIGDDTRRTRQQKKSPPVTIKNIGNGTVQVSIGDNSPNMINSSVNTQELISELISLISSAKLPSNIGSDATEYLDAVSDEFVRDQPRKSILKTAKEKLEKVVDFAKIGTNAVNNSADIINKGQDLINIINEYIK
ncbi:hypothetical protein [Anaerospora hongkongensis]|uniref:hypothetical protein n=1 Tax=Anaerospora hongkongensis TaxID=244830 RepID=UPI0028A27EA5|nr:hypothetical protein [Anaerospora hongkongensis]